MDRDLDFGARPLVVAAHPDDETIGAGALLLRLGRGVVVHVADGAPRDARLFPAGFAVSRERYAAIRREEAQRALAIAGVTPDRIRSLGAVDHEVASGLDDVVDELVLLFVSLRPDVVVTHAYEGGHPDHDATAFAVHAAAALLGRSGEPPPRIVEMATYHAGGGAFTAGDFLPGRPSPVTSLHLTEVERAKKQAMLACFRTRAAALSGFPVAVERFRPAPAYDFTRPPHEGPLHYERAGLSLNGERFRELTRAALADLDLSDQPCL